MVYEGVSVCHCRPDFCTELDLAFGFSPDDGTHMGLENADDSVPVLVRFGIVHTFLLVVYLDDGAYPLPFSPVQPVQDGGGTVRYYARHALDITSLIHQLLPYSLAY